MAEPPPAPHRPPRPPLRPLSATLDLREEAPARHRQSRGVPREPDALLAAYRDRPLPPTRHHDGRPRLIDVTAVDPDDPVDPVGPVGPDAREDRSATQGATPAEPLAEETTPTTATTTTTTTTTTATAADTAARVERRRFYVGDLVVRRFRLWSVLKVALASFVCLFAVLLLAGVILWHLANREGWVTGWTGFLVDIGFTDAAVDGTTLFRASVTAAGILVATATFLAVASACIYNQISGLVGGIEMTFGPRRRRGRERRHPLR
ncbi:MAG: DUF3566 domain-containing protein [Acidimicrobiales bacterium]|nr:DUF3566 domain-containing protein [Acidimicrobiales bacterium]